MLWASCIELVALNALHRCFSSRGLCALRSRRWDLQPFEREDRVYQGTAGEGVAVDAQGNVYAAEGPNSLSSAGGAFTKYSVR